MPSDKTVLNTDTQIHSRARMGWGAFSEMSMAGNKFIQYVLRKLHVAGGMWAEKASVCALLPGTDWPIKNEQINFPIHFFVYQSVINVTHCWCN